MHVDVQVLDHRDAGGFRRHNHALDGAMAESDAQKPLCTLEVLGVHGGEHELRGEMQYRARVCFKPALRNLDDTAVAELIILEYKCTRENITLERARL